MKLLADFTLYHLDQMTRPLPDESQNRLEWSQKNRGRRVGPLLCGIALLGELSKPDALDHLNQKIGYTRPPRTEAAERLVLANLSRRIWSGLIILGLSFGLLGFIAWLVFQS